MKKRIENNLSNITSFEALKEFLLYHMEESKRFALKNARKCKDDSRIWFYELNNTRRAKVIKKAYKEFKTLEKKDERT